jgi:hypothetical protein
VGRSYGMHGRGMYKLLVGKLKGMRPLGRLRHRFHHNETWGGCVEWIQLAQNRNWWWNF